MSWLGVLWIFVWLQTSFLCCCVMVGHTCAWEQVHMFHVGTRPKRIILLQKSLVICICAISLRKCTSWGVLGVFVRLPTSIWVVYDGWPCMCISLGAHVSCWHAPKMYHIALKIARHMRMGYWFEKMYWLGGVGSLCSAPNLIFDCFRGCAHPPNHRRTRFYTPKTHF